MAVHIIKRGGATFVLHRLPIGLRVKNSADPRHVGELIAVLHDHCRVKFDNGTMTDVRVDRIVPAEEDE